MSTFASLLPSFLSSSFQLSHLKLYSIFVLLALRIIKNFFNFEPFSFFIYISLSFIFILYSSASVDTVLLPDTSQGLRKRGLYYYIYSCLPVSDNRRAKDGWLIRSEQSALNLLWCDQDNKRVLCLKCNEIHLLLHYICSWMIHVSIQVLGVSSCDAKMLTHAQVQRWLH